jgi:hypothetical protein
MLCEYVIDDDQKLIAARCETICLMQEIDETVEPPAGVRQSSRFKTGQ